MKILNKGLASMLWALATACAGVAATQAVVLPEAVQEKLHGLANDFVQAEGFVPIEDVDAFTQEEWYTPQRFPSWNTDSVFLPDSDMTPIQKAVMLVEYLESELPHVRYLVSYRPEYVY